MERVKEVQTFHVIKKTKSPVIQRLEGEEGQVIKLPDTDERYQVDYYYEDPLHHQQIQDIIQPLIEGSLGDKEVGYVPRYHLISGGGIASSQLMLGSKQAIHQRSILRSMVVGLLLKMSQQSKRMKVKGNIHKEQRLEMSIVEIYKDQVIDLCSDHKVSIYEHVSNGYMLDGNRRIWIKSIQDYETHIQYAMKKAHQTNLLFTSHLLVEFHVIRKARTVLQTDYLGDVSESSAISGSLSPSLFQFPLESRVTPNRKVGGGVCVGTYTENMRKAEHNDMHSVIQVTLLAPLDPVSGARLTTEQNTIKQSLMTLGYLVDYEAGLAEEKVGLSWASFKLTQMLSSGFSKGNRLHFMSVTVDHITAVSSARWLLQVVQSSRALNGKVYTTTVEGKEKVVKGKKAAGFQVGKEQEVRKEEKERRERMEMPQDDDVEKWKEAYFKKCKQVELIADQFHTMEREMEARMSALQAKSNERESMLENRIVEVETKGEKLQQMLKQVSEPYGWVQGNEKESAAKQRKRKEDQDLLLRLQELVIQQAKELQRMHGEIEMLSEAKHK